MNSYFYDVEVFPNFFSVTFIGVDQTHSFYEWMDAAYYVGTSKDRVEWKSEAEGLQTFLSGENYLIGYNNHSYDDLVLTKWLALRGESVTDRVAQIYSYSKGLIQGNIQRGRNPFTSLDLATIIQKGKHKKSLKEVAINMRWRKIQDLPYPYDHHVLNDQIETILSYNLNDVLITQELHRYIRNDINLRVRIARKYGVDVTSASDSFMSSRLLDKLYADTVGHWGFKKDRTPRQIMSMKDIIVPGFDFSTPKMRLWLDGLKREQVSADTQWGRQVLIGETVYDMKKGGLHSIHPEPAVYEATEEEEIEDIDAASFYPRLMINLLIKPAHLSPKFLSLVKRLTEQRLAAKARKDQDPDAAVEAEALKVTINSIFGKFNYENYWLYDTLALYRITINGQLFLLKLIESLESIGCTVFYANTDGVTVKFKRTLRADFDRVLDEWQREFSIELENSRYQKFILRDVNNYLVIKPDGTTKAKGDLNKDNLIQPTPMMGLMKKFAYPVVTQAIHEFFVNGTDPRTTISQNRDPLDFCISQKVGKTFSRVTFEQIIGLTIHSSDSQRTNRYLVSQPRYGGSLFKWKGDRRHQVVAGQHILLLNDLDQEPDARNKVMDSWYIREAEKVIGLFKTKQLTLF
jgi:hypothetical protein